MEQGSYEFSEYVGRRIEKRIGAEQMMADTPETSVIIRAYNEARHLPALFDALDQQTNISYEVVFVDSGSVDGSRDIAEARGAKVVRINSHDFTFGYSLNVGIKSAVGKYIAIASAHTIPCDEQWLVNLVKPLRDDKVAMVYGRQLGVPSSKFSECEDFRRVFGDKRLRHYGTKFFANNANSALPRDLWMKNSFDESLPGLEDIGWAKYWAEQGYYIIYEPSAALFHVHEETWSQVQHRYYREAVAARTIGIKSRMSALSEVLREIFFAKIDLIRSFYPIDNPAARQLTFTSRVKEIILFRINKLSGTLRGLLETTDISTSEDHTEFFFGRSNRAVVVAGPRNAYLDYRPIPIPRPGEVIIRVHTVAVCATDREIFEGELGYFKKDPSLYPIVPGHEFSGEIVSIGAKVSQLRDGDRVVVECIQGCGACDACTGGNQIRCSERAELGVIGRDGAYAEFVSTPARFVHQLPSGIDMSVASLVEPTAVIMKALGRLPNCDQFSSTTHLFGVLGAGPLGHLCALVLQHLGHRVRVFDHREERLSLLVESSIEVSKSFSNLSDCDAIFELTGSNEALNAALTISPAGATIVLLGFPYGEQTYNFDGVSGYDKIVIGSVGSSKNDFEKAIRLLPDLDLSKFVGNRIPISQFHTAWELSRKPNVLKVMIDPRMD